MPIYDVTYVAPRTTKVFARTPKEAEWEAKRQLVGVFGARLVSVVPEEEAKPVVRDEGIPGG